MGVPTGVVRGVAKGVRGVPAGTNGTTWMGGPVVGKVQYYFHDLYSKHLLSVGVATGSCDIT